jgi:membrane fusion protein (multidrug efflux system)
VESDLQFVKAQIEKTEIRAPFDGQVGLKNVSEGSFVSQEYLIASIQQMHPVKIDFSLPEKYSTAVKAGQKITFTIEGDTTRHSGEVYAVEPRVDPATRSIRIRALAPNPGNKILPGVFARVNFGLNHIGEAVLIPTQAIIPVLKGKKVLVAENGMAISKVITTGIRQDKDVEIITGLKPGDTLITSGIMQLRDSMPVNVRITD